METKNLTAAFTRKSILICVILLTAVTPAFSQNQTMLILPVFDLELIASILGVVALATFMFIAMIKYKKKEKKEIKDTRNERSRSHTHQGTNTHRRHTNMGHFKY